MLMYWCHSKVDLFFNINVDVFVNVNVNDYVNVNVVLGGKYSGVLGKYSGIWGQIQWYLGANTGVFGSKYRGIWGQIQGYLGANTGVFGTNTGVFGTKTGVFGTNTGVFATPHKSVLLKRAAPANLAIPVPLLYGDIIFAGGTPLTGATPVLSVN